MTLIASLWPTLLLATGLVAWGWALWWVLTGGLTKARKT